MKRAIVFVAFLVFAVAVFQPVESRAASQLDKIREEMKQLKREMEYVEDNKVKVEKDKQYVATKKTQTAESINLILSQIDSVNAELQLVNTQIADTENALLAAGEELVQAEERIVERDALLESRIRLMYTSGFVSYTDVLLSSNSFMDFLDRMDALKSILGQDREILAAHQADKDLILNNKAEIETKLADIRTLYSKKEDYYNTLIEKEKEKEVMIAQYNAQMEDLEHRAEELEEISAEQEAVLMKLARAEKAEIEKQNKKKNKVYYSGGKLAMPIKDDFRESSGFGPRTHPITGKKGKMHNGLDFAAPAGTPIYAAESGTVIVAQSMSGYGNTVIIDHGNGLWTLYAHIRKGGIKVEKGESVKRGQKIAEVGTTGTSTGNHLHFEVRLNEKPVNPVNYLKG